MYPSASTTRPAYLIAKTRSHEADVTREAKLRYQWGSIQDDTAATVESARHCDANINGFVDAQSLDQFNDRVDVILR
jgi:hypothetical protein